MRKALTLLLLTALLTAPLAGCSDTSDAPAKTTEGKGNSTTASTTAGTDDNIPEYNPDEANPASDFEYTVGEDGGITITKYIGTDTDVVIPEKIEGKNVTVIGEGAFQGCGTVKSLSMPDTVTSVEYCAIYGCDLLTTVRLSKNLKSIGEAAFNHCDVLSTISLPDSLNYIGPIAFSHCKSLKHITIPAHCFDNSQGETYSAFSKSGLETIELKEGLSLIPNGTFADTNIQEVVIPSSVQRIGQSAFSDCKKLEKITLNEGLVSIEPNVIKNTKITELFIPATVEKIYIQFFNSATMLKKVYFKGNAPELVTNDLSVTQFDVIFSIYYHEGATGFTTPEWNGYKTEIW